MFIEKRKVGEIKTKRNKSEIRENHLKEKSVRYTPGYIFIRVNPFSSIFILGGVWGEGGGC